MAAFSGPTVTVNGAILFLDARDTTSYPGTGTTWFDLSGNGNHQTLQNSANVAYSNGYFTTGSNGYANRSDAAQAPAIGLGAANVTVLTGTGAQTYTVPSFWNNSANSIELIGGGAGGGGFNNNGGGGGAYSRVSNVSLTPGNAIYLNVGTGGARTFNGGNTWVNYTVNSAPATISAGALARGGVSTGTQAASIGNVTYNGGTGGAQAFSPGGGGGGAGGPNGQGANGGSAGSSNFGGGGGGGANGGSSGASANSILGAAGGNGPGGTGGGSPPGGNGSNGGGGAGAIAPLQGLAGPGGTGGTYNVAAWGSNLGPGGGGGGGGTGGAGGTYGGGAGGGTSTGSGGQGLAVITTTPVGGTPSASAWIYVDSLGSSRSIVSCTTNTSSNDGWTFGISATNYLRVTLNGTTPVNFASTSAAISAQTWQHVAFVASGSTLTFYINGNAYDSISIGSAGMSGTASSLTVGNGPDNAYLNGRISAVSVYNRPLSSIEMAKNFNALRGRYGL